MRELTIADLMAPGDCWALLVDEGMRPEQAYDLIAERAAQPDFQDVIDHYRKYVDGREILRLTYSYWDKVGLPCPWDRVLDLGPVY